MNFESDEEAPHNEAVPKRFNIYKHPVHGYRAVNTGWSWPAFLFDWIWAFSRGMWQTGAFILLAYLLPSAVVALVGNSECMPACSLRLYIATYLTAVLLLWLKVYCGRVGNRLMGDDLAVKGYKFMGSTPALSGDDAIARAFNGEVDQGPAIANDTSVIDTPQATFADAAGWPDARSPQMFFLASVIVIPVSLFSYVRFLDRPISYENETKWTDLQTFALAEIGNADAQKDVAVAYELGSGVPQDEAKALDWYRRAANNGERISMRELAERYWHGDSVTKDVTKSIEWYKKAAEAGSSSAQNDLGWIYVNGENGIAVNYGEALRLFRESSKYWHAEQERNEDSKCYDGCLGLGFLYAQGFGVPKDAAKAEFYLRKGMEDEVINPPYLGYHFLRNTSAVLDAAEPYLKDDLTDDNKGLELLRKAAMVADEADSSPLLFMLGAAMACNKFGDTDKTLFTACAMRIRDAVNLGVTMKEQLDKLQ